MIIPIIFLLWVASTILVVSSATAIVRRIDPKSGRFAIVHTIIISWSWLVVSSVSMGVIHKISGITVTITVLSISLISFLVAYNFNYFLNKKVTIMKDRSCMWNIEAAKPR